MHDRFNLNITYQTHRRCTCTVCGPVGSFMARHNRLYDTIVNGTSVRPSTRISEQCDLSLFERSEFLIATCEKKKTDRLCVCGCSANLLVLVLGRQIVYGQNTVYLCLSKSIVFENTQQYKHHVVRIIARSGVSPPGARSDGRHWCQAARTAPTCT